MTVPAEAMMHQTGINKKMRQGVEGLYYSESRYFPRFKFLQPTIFFSSKFHFDVLDFQLLMCSSGRLKC